MERVKKYIKLVVVAHKGGKYSIDESVESIYNYFQRSEVWHLNSIYKGIVIGYLLGIGLTKIIN